MNTTRKNLSGFEALNPADQNVGMAANTQPLDTIEAMQVAVEQEAVQAAPLNLVQAVNQVVASAQAAANRPRLQASPSDFSPGDVGCAERFVDQWGEVTRYDTGRGQWMVWTGTHWEVDDAGLVKKRQISVAKSILKAEVAALYTLVQEPGDYYERKAKEMAKEGTRLHANHALDASLSVAKVFPQMTVRTSAFDPDPMRLNCQSGVIDLANGAVMPPRPEALHSKIVPVAIAEPGTPCPRWMKFLDEIMCGDQELVDYLQHLVGYILTGRMDEQCFFVLYGHGSNGKSTFINVIKALTGTYGQSVDFKTFMEMNRGDSPRNDLAMLVGKRFVVSPEGKEGAALDEPVIKQFTGGDTVTVRFLNKEFFEFQPVGKILFATNHLPVVRGQDYGIWRRMRLVPFLASFKAKQADPTLFDKLMEELPAILRWAVDGSQLWLKKGLWIPQAVEQATLSYRSAMDVFETFINERCDVDPNAKTGSQDMYDAYLDWCVPAGIRLPMKQATFNQKLEERGYVKKKTATQNLWLGIGLKPKGAGGSSTGAFNAPATSGVPGGELDFSV